MLRAGAATARERGQQMLELAQTSSRKPAPEGRVNAALSAATARERGQQRMKFAETSSKRPRPKGAAMLRFAQQPRASAVSKRWSSHKLHQESAPEGRVNAARERSNRA